MAKIIPALIIRNCYDCPMRQDGGVVEDFCGEEQKYISCEGDFPSWCPLQDLREE